MSNHGLVHRTISAAVWLSSIDNFAHLLLFLLGQFNIPRRPVLLQTGRLSCSRDRDQALGNYPGERDLANLASLAGS